MEEIKTTEKQRKKELEQRITETPWLERWREKIERGGDRKRGESDSGSQYFLNSFASTQLGIKAIIPGLIPNPTELAAFRDKPGWQSINKAGTNKNNTHILKHMHMTQSQAQAGMQAIRKKK